MKQTIRLTESDLHKLIKEAVSEISDRTIWNAAKKADDNYVVNNTPTRKYGQMMRLGGESEDRIRRGGPEVDKLMNAIGEDLDTYGDLEYYVDKDYFHRRDIVDEIMDKYNLPLLTAYVALDEYLNRTYGKNDEVNESISRAIRKFLR